MIAAAADVATASSTSIWDTVTRIGVVLSILLAVKGLGLFRQTKYSVHGARSPLHNLAGFHSPALFAMAFVNRGSTPVTFYDFEIAQPRLGDDLITDDGRFVLHPGATWYVDGVERGTFAATQAQSKVNYDTRRVTVEPHSSRTEIFELSLFEVPANFSGDRHAWPANFAPILEFEDSFGTRYVTDEKGTRKGRYQYPHQAALDATFKTTPPTGVSRVRWPLSPWWRTQTEDYPAS